MINDKSKSVKNIIDLIQKEKWLLDVNKNNFQKKEYKNIKEEMLDLLPILKERELKRIEYILREKTL